MCDCFHLAFPNWHADSAGPGGGRRLRGPGPGGRADPIYDEPSQFTEGERPRPQGSSPVEEYPEKYGDSDQECETEYDSYHKGATGKKPKKSGLGSMFEKRSTPKMSKLKDPPSPESGVIVKTAKDGCAEGLVYGGGGKDGIFIKEVVPESPASRSLNLKEGDQVLSATVYFDNMSYEDAMQILEHAQAYKLKFCLKRKPDISETEPALEFVIPEDEVYAPDMREQGKTKRRSDARISWPKFSSLGKGRKSHFTRSHSSSEADEQRKLELSPTTSDTESPIKSQDALKGKKKHKARFSGLKKRGRISSSEDQDTDTTVIGKTLQTGDASDMISHGELESPTRETSEVCMAGDQTVLDKSNKNLSELEAGQHTMELITLDSTLKTTDLTVTVADKGMSSGIKSPDGKKKKERTELKIKILGKDKSDKKDGKAKPSPKRLKTLGASIETADEPEKETTDIIQAFEGHTALQEDLTGPDANERSKGTSAKVEMPKVEFDISNVAFLRKSPHKIEDKKKKGKDKKTKTKDANYKLPKVGLSDVTIEETTQDINVNEENKTKLEQRLDAGTGKRDDPYEQLSRAQLPKREEIEIPGMEDIQMRSTAQGMKKPTLNVYHKEHQTDTVQMSIDVDSVKEAISKLPGYKLPKVDVSGAPIPDEITVIDANAQRISVKTPTKVAATKEKGVTQVITSDMRASQEISKTTVKLPKIPSDLSTDIVLPETKVDLKKYKTKAKQTEKGIETQLNKRDDIVIPGKESTQVRILQVKDPGKVQGIEVSDKKLRKEKKNTSGSGMTKPEIKLPEVGIDFLKQNASKQKGAVKTPETMEQHSQLEGLISGVKITDIDGIEYIDADGESTKKNGGILLTGLHFTEDGKADKQINIDGLEDAKCKLARGPDLDLNYSHKDTEIDQPEANIDVNLIEVDFKQPSAKVEGKPTQIMIGTKPFEASALKFKMPSFKLPKFGIATEVPNTDKEIETEEDKIQISAPYIDDNVPDVKAELSLHDAESAAIDQQPGVEVDARLKKPRFSMPKVTLSKSNVKAPDVDVKLPDVNIAISEGKVKEGEEAVNKKPKESKIDIDSQGGKFQMPKFEIRVPKTKQPEIDSGSTSLLQNDVDVALPKSKLEVNLPEVELKEPSAEIEVQAPEIQVKTKSKDEAPSRFKMPNFKLPKFGASATLGSREKDVKTEGGDINILEADLKVDIEAPKVDIEGPSIEMKPADVDHEGKGLKLKMPSFGFSVPQVKQHEIDLSLSRKDVDVKLPEAKVEVQLPEVELKEPSAEIEVQAPGIKVKTKSKEDSPSRFKMPNFKLPKFGIIAPSVTMEAPEKDVKIEGSHMIIPEADLKVDIEAPKVDIEGPSIEMKPADVDHEGKGLKLKMPSLGFSVPQVKQHEIDLSLSRKDVDVKLPEAKVEVQLPEVELKEPSAEIEVQAPEIKVKTKSKEDSPSRFEMPKLKLPKFGVIAPSVTMEAPEKDLKIEGGHINIPEADLKVDIEAPKVDIEGPSIEMKPADVDHEGKGLKIKMPSFGFSVPQVKQHEIDLSLSRKNVDVKLPEATVEVQLPEVELKEPSAEIEVQAPGIKVKTKSKEDSPSRFKMPNFKLPKFGIIAPSVTMEAPEKDVKIEGSHMIIPEADLKVDIEAPKVDIEGPSIEMKPADVDHEGKGLKLKMPSLGFSVPQVKQHEIDLSLSRKDVDVKLPEAKVEVQLPEVELKEPSAEIEVQAPEIKVKTKSKEDSPSRFEMPKLKLPKFGVIAPSVTMEAPEKDLKIERGHINIPEADLKVDIEAPKFDIEGPSIEMKPTDVDHEGEGLKFKMPSLGFSVPQVKQHEIDLSLSRKDVDVKLPEAKVEVHLPEVELKEPSAEIEVQAPEIKVKTKSKEDSPSRFKMPNFKLPKFGVSAPSVTMEAPEKDVKIEGGHINIPEADLKVDIEAPKVDIEGPSVEMKPADVDHEGKGLKFKMPSLGFSVPQVKQHEIDLSLSRKDVDVKLPEAKVEVQLPEVELKEPSAEIEVQAPGIKVKTKSKEDSPSRFKMPNFKLPKFGVSAPSVTIEAPEKDVKIEGGHINIPEADLKVNIEAPKVDVEGPSIEMKPTDVDHEEKGLKFKMPSLGFSVPQVKQHEIDLSLSWKDVDVKLPEAKVEVQLPEVELKEPSAEIEVQAPEIKVKTKSKEDSPSRFKMPNFKLPKFGVSAPSVTIEAPEKDVKIEGGHINIPEADLKVDIEAPKVDIEGPSIEMKPADVDHEGKGLKFKMPSLGFSVPQVKQHEIDLSLSRKDVDVKLPEAKVEVHLPEVELKEPSAEIEVQAPGIKVKTKSKEDSPSRFKMPNFKLPKFGVSAPSVTIEAPEKDLKIEGGHINIPKADLKVDIEAPKVDIEGPSIEMKPTDVDHEGKGLKFKMPSLGFSVPQVKQHEIDLSLSRKDVDVKLPEAKVEVQLPEVELKEPSAEIEVQAPGIKVKTKSKEDSPSRFKMPNFKLPKFGVSAPSVTIEAPEKDVKIEGGHINIPEADLKVDIEAPKVDVEGPSIEMKPADVDHEGKGLKFKMPSLGFSVPQVKQHEIDLSLSRKDVDVKLPEAKVEVHLPEVELKEPSAEIEVQAPEIKVKTKSKEDSPSRFKMPNFKLPKFGVSAPSVTIEAPEKDVKIEGGHINIPEADLKVDIEAPKVDVEGPSIEMKPADVDHEGKGLKFKMPSLGFSVPQVKQHEIDLSLSRKDVDVKLPEAKVEVHLPEVELKEPSAEIEVQAPEIKVKTKSKEDSPSRFKMPNFKLPKFGVSAPSVTIEAPEKDLKIEGGHINIPKADLKVDIEAPKVDIEGPSIEMKPTDVDHEGKGLKFKMPSLGFSVPQVKQHEIDLSLSRKDVDVKLPEAKVEVQLPEVELKEPSAEIEVQAPEIKVKTKSKEDSPSRFKMPNFKLPKFGVSAPSVTIEAPEKDVKIEGGHINIPEADLKVDIEAPKVDVEGPSIEMKPADVDHEGKGLKFKMPSLGFSVPQVKQHEIDLSLSRKDVDVKLPEAKVEVHLPEVELKEPSAEIEVQAPEIKVKTKSKEDSPSRFKMPNFKLPKFGVSAPSVTIEAPEKDVKIEGGHINIPEADLKVDIEAPKVDVEGPSIEMKPADVDHEGKGLKIKMPSLGFSVPQVKQHEIDLSLSRKDVDVKLPEPKVEVHLPEVELKEPSADIEVQAPEIKVKTKSKEDSPSRFKMPNFKLPKFGVSAPTVTTEAPEKDVKIEGGHINIPEADLKVDIEAPKVDVEGPSIEMKPADVDHEGKGLKIKMPSLGFSVPQVKQHEIDLSLSRKDVDVKLPEAKVEVHLPEVELKEPSAEIEVQAPEIKVKTKSKEDSPSRFKMPNFKLPKFGVSAPSVTIEAPEKDVKIEGGHINIPEADLKVDIKAPKVDVEGPSIEMKPADVDHEGKGLKFKMPSLGFSVPQVKQHEIDLSLSRKDVDVKLPEAKVEVHLPEVELKEPSAEIEVQAPEIKVKTKSKEDSPSRFKMPNFKLPKFGVSAPSVTIEAPEKDVKIEGGHINIPEADLKVDIEAPKVDVEGPSIEMKPADVDHKGKGLKFKMPSLGFSVPQVKQHEIDLSLSRKDVDVKLPEAKVEVHLPEVELKEPSAEIEVQAPEIKVKTKSKEDSPSRFKMPNFKLPKFGVSAPSVTIEAPEKDVKIEGGDIYIPEEVLTVDIEGTLIQMKTTDAHHEGKGNKLKMPSLGFSRLQVKQPESSFSTSKKNVKDSDIVVNLETPKVDVAAPEAKLEVFLPDVEVKKPSVQTPAAELVANVKKSKFSLSGFHFSKGSGEEAEIIGELSPVDVSLSEAEVKVKHSEMETESGGQQIKFNLPKFQIAVPEVRGPNDDLNALNKNVDVHRAQTDESKLKEDMSVTIKGPSVDIKTNEYKGTDTEIANSETNSLGLGSPSKFKLPSFKMPKLNFSRAKPQDELIPVVSEGKDELKIEIQLKGEGEIPNVTSIRQILNNSEIEFERDKDDYLEQPKEVLNIAEPLTEQKQMKIKEITTKQDTTKSPERTGWFKFPKFGLSSPSSPAKTPEYDEKKCPIGEMVDEEISPTGSVQSSDAFADISSAMTSENLGLSLSSPTKVTVKYSDSNTVTGSENMDSKVITSTTRTEQISVEPNLPEKVTILSSGVSSSSEDTLRLESGKIHVIASNIQMTPEAQHALLLNAVQLQPAGGPHVKSETDEAASWTVKDSQGGKRTIFERHLVRKTSSERSESKETVVITKQITRTSRFESSEPISGETATSIQQLRQSVHSEKMRFFDEMEK